MKKLNLGMQKLFTTKVLEQSQLSDIHGSWKWDYLLFPFIMYLSISCQEKNTWQDGQVTGYVIDTVLIDSKERILDLRGNMMTSALDEEEKSFFLYNNFDHSIDEIDLDRQVLVKSYPLEAEGPNGVGNILFGIQLLNDSMLFTKSYIISAVIDRNSKVAHRIGWEEARDSSGVQLEQLPRRYEVVSGAEDLMVFGLNYDIKNRKVLLDVLSDKDNSVKRFDVDPEKSFQDFFFRFDDHVNFMEPGVRLSSDKNYVQISHEFSNEILLFNTEGDFVKVVHYEPQLTPKRAKTPEGPEFKSREQIQKDYRHILEQVRFEPPVWDKVKNRYFRFSSKRIFEELEGEGKVTTKTKDRIVFLSVFDAEFNLISEIEIEELNDESVKYFAKDGNLWVSHNFSDELGFLVFDL